MRCKWCHLSNPLYVSYHDTEWGQLRTDDAYLFEMLLLESFQAGLSWECILNKRENFRRAYDGFDLDTVCAYGEDKVEELLQDPGIIRNRAKIQASIKNSRIYRSIVEEAGSFEAYLERFTGGKTVFEPDVRITTSPVSDALSADLKKRGMTFVGSTTIYAFLQAIGSVNAHQKDCFCYQDFLTRG